MTAISSDIPVRRNTLLLAGAMAVYSSVLQLVAAVSSLTFVLVTGVEGLLGLGPAIFLVASGLAAVPAGRLMDRIGRRPVVAGGNSNGDVPMLRFARTGGRPALRLLLLHDDAEREFDYTAGAELALERAATEGWTVVSVRDDWTAVF